MVNLSQQVNMASNDEVVANERTRATLFPITLTGTAGLGSAYTTNPQGVNWIAGFGPPRTGTGATGVTALAADLLTGIITWKSTAATNQAFTLDTAANIIAAVNSISSGAQVGDIISCLVINSTASTAGGTLTVTPSASGGSLDANQTAPVIAVGASRVVYIYISNVATPAYVVYT